MVKVRIGLNASRNASIPWRRVSGEPIVDEDVRKDTRRAAMKASSSSTPLVMVIQ